MRTFLLIALIISLVAVDVVMPDQFDASSVIENGPPPLALFCKTDACANTLSLMIHNSSTINCAIYDLGHPTVITALMERIESNADVRVILDDRSVPTQLSQTGESVQIESSHIRIDTPNGQMHNKFCIFDNKIVWSGSFNPTIRGDLNNDNNVVILSSPALAQTFSDEFEELWNKIYRGGKKTRHPIVHIGNVTVEVLFCPDDGCANKIIKVIGYANQSIKFMTFSFTHKGIADAVIDANTQLNVSVQGVMEKSGNQKVSVYKYFRDAGIDVRYDTNKANMHHKVFIIDESIVITGSFNPTQNGDSRNDENILIIHDPIIAKQFGKEMDRIWPPLPPPKNLSS